MSRTDVIYDRLVATEKLKSGTKYERLAAIVFKILDGRSVVHDMKLRGTTGVKHQIDVTVGSPTGDKRILIECKDYETEKIGLGTVRDFFGVVHDTRPDEAFIVTALGFTKPARDFAAGQGIKLALMRPVKEEDLEGRLLSFHLTLSASIPGVPAITWAVDEDEVRRLFPTGMPTGMRLEVETLRLRNADGTTEPFGPTIHSAVRRGALPLGESGTATGRERFDGPRWLVAPGLPEIPARGFDWSCEWHVETMESVSGVGLDGLVAELVLRTVDGEIDRIFTNKQISQWSIDPLTGEVRAS